jgi:hypothetical protein
MSMLTERERTIPLLTMQLTNMRKSHDAYVASLNLAHRQELDALTTYANCLEEQKGFVRDQSAPVTGTGTSFSR